MTVATFGLVVSSPGGPAILYEPGVTAEQMERMREILGLDDPIPVQYGRWLERTITGDLGVSYTLGQPVGELIAERLPNTLILAGSGLLFALVVGVPLGIVAALRKGSWADNLVSGISFFGLSMPVFWYGLVLIVLFAVQLRWLPAGGMFTLGEESFVDLLRHLILPAVVLGTVHLAEITRYTRSSLLSVLRQDYVRTARAKGIAGWRVLVKHALRNALIPIVTIVGLMFPQVVAGAAITEQVFAWPGMGQLVVSAAFQRDYPTLMGVTLIVSTVVILANLITDLLYTYLDPRIRME